MRRKMDPELEASWAIGIATLRGKSLSHAAEQLKRLMLKALGHRPVQEETPARHERPFGGAFFAPVQKSNSGHAERILDFHFSLYYPYYIIYL